MLKSLCLPELVTQKECDSMRLSRGNFATFREQVNTEPLSQQLLLQSNQLKKYGTGIYGKNHLLVKAQENIEAVIRKTLDFYDCVEISLPLLQPKSIFEKSKNFKNYYFHRQMLYCNMPNRTLRLVPSAEEAVLEFVKSNVRSYKQLPVNVYQIGTKFRNEYCSRGGLLRSREFTMMDAYSFHVSEEDLANEYQSMHNAYLDIFDALGINIIPVQALSCYTGEEYSEEFMAIADYGEETLLVNNDFTICFNKEILDLPNAYEIILSNYGIKFNQNQFHEEHCIKLGRISQLGQNYSRKLKGIFTGPDNKPHYYYMGYYSIGVSRTLAAMCEINCDFSGLAWPLSIAPYLVHIVYNENKSDEAEQLYKKLLKVTSKVAIDDRPNISFGAKLKDAVLFGNPYVVIIGNSFDGNTYEVDARLTGSKLKLSFDELVSLITRIQLQHS